MKKYEKLAYIEGKGSIPVQLFKDFKANKPTEKLGHISPNIKGKYTLGNLNNCLPVYVNNAIIEANGGVITDYVSGKTEENGMDIMKKAVESVKRKEERKNFDRPFDKKKKTFDKKSSKNVEKEVKVEETKKEEKVQVKEEKTVEKKAEVKEDLTEKTVAELRELAKAKEIKGYSTMKKAELLEALK